jgi:predicted kinase
MKIILTNNYKEIYDKIFYILRGLPGSGKSFLAKQLAGKTGTAFASDDFFIDEEGNYKWDADKLTAAHRWNFERVKKAISQGISPIILDNTNVTKLDLRQIKPLIEYAENQGYKVRIEETKTPWAFNPEELSKRNTHGVPLESIRDKIRSWYQNPTVEDIKNDFKTTNLGS